MAATARQQSSKLRNRSKAARGLNVSGSDWNADHLEAFAITHTQDERLLHFLAEKGFPEKERLKKDVTELMQASIGTNAKYSNKRHADLFQMAHEKNVQFGPFLAFIAVVSQAWKETEEVGSRTSARILASKTSEAQAAQRDILAHMVENAYATPQKQSKPISPIAPENTPQHVAARQEKAEIVSNTMAVLFLQAILESSRDLISSPEGNYLEWHFIPKWLHVASSRATCQCINDGSLFRKHWQKKGSDREWINVDNLLYASIKVRAGLFPLTPLPPPSLFSITTK